MPGPWEDYKKPATGPWNDFAPKSSSNSRAKNTAAESAFQGAVQGASLGFADEVIGAVKAAKDAATNPDKRGLNELAKTYKEYRDEARGKFERARIDNPRSYTGGEIAGSLATSVVPGFGWMNAAKGASTGAKIGKAALAGGLIGAGTSNADQTKGQFGDNVGDLVKDIVQGASTGALAQGAISGAGSVIGGAVERFKRIPESRAVKAVTGQNISALRQIANTTLKSPGDVNAAQQRIVKVGRDILDEPGVLGPLSKVEDMAPKLAQARAKYGGLIGEVGAKIDELTPGAIDAKKIANNVIKYAETIPETMQGRKLKDKLLEEAANFEQIGKLSFIDAQKFKNQFKYRAVDADALISNQDATNALRKIIGGEMDDTAAKLAKTGPQEVQDLLKNYATYKSKYGSFKAASDAATDRVQKNLTNRFPSPSDYGMGAVVGAAQSIAHGGISPGTVALGLGTAAANKFARERGSALAARSAEAIINAYKSGGVQALVEAARPVIEAARKGNAAAAATFQILDQSNPEALKILNQQEAMKRRIGDK